MAEFPRTRRKPERKYIGGWTREKVRSVAKLVGQLEGHPGWEAIQELIDAQCENEQRKLIFSPKPLSQAEYALVAGRIRGFRAVQTAVEQVLAEARAIDEEDRRASERQTAAEGA